VTKKKIKQLEKELKKSTSKALKEIEELKKKQKALLKAL
jgi:hypothetical protein